MVIKHYKNWNQVKEYIDTIQKLIEIDGVREIHILFTDYNSNPNLKSWYIDVKLEGEKLE